MPGRFFHTPPTPPVHSVRLAAALLAVLLFSSILVVSGCERQTAHTAVARNGVLDLSDWDAIRDGPIALNGQWEFYWERLLPPEDFQPGASAPERTGFLSFPGSGGTFLLMARTSPTGGGPLFACVFFPAPEGASWPSNFSPYQPRSACGPTDDSLPGQGRWATAQRRKYPPAT